MEKITLDLPEEVTRRARASAQRTGRTVEAVLAEWLVRAVEHDLNTADDTHQAFDKAFNFFVFDVGEWPEKLTLRREDEYGDTER